MNETGIISFVATNMVVVNERGDMFYNPQLEDCVETVTSSEWFQNFKKYMDVPKSSLPPAYANRESGIYSPIFEVECEGRQMEIFCLTAVYEINGMMYYPILMTDFADLQRQWEALVNLGLEDYALLGSGNRVLYSNLGPEASDIRLDELDILEGKQYEVLMQEDNRGMNYSVMFSYPAEGLRLVIHAGPDVLFSPYTSVYWMLMVTFVIAFSVFLLLISWVLKKILGRLTKLSRTMKRVKNGDYSVVVKDDYEDEIGDLSQTFNVMVSRMQYHIKNTLEQEKRERQIQYNLMVAAINPHFIYNTLNTVTYLAEQQRMEEVSQVNQALVDILKDRLKTSTDHSFDKVKNELRILRQYLYIQNHLCHNTTDLVFNVSPEDMELSIPKNILQPLVENSLLHGILLRSREEMGNGRIEITVKKVENGILVSISDNGIGMDQETIDRYFGCHDIPENCGENGTDHIGVYNVRQRLSYLYQGRCRITVQSVVGQGTEIMIILPEY